MRSGYSELLGSMRPTSTNAVVAGEADPSEVIEVSVILRRANPIDVSRRRSVLTREQLTERHGAQDNDVQAVSAFAASNSLSVVKVSQGTRTIRLSGTVGQFANAFDTTIVNLDEQGAVSRALSGPIFIPEALNGVVVAVLGLDTRRVARSHVQLVQSQNVLSSFYATQIRDLYHFPPDLRGDRQTIAILEFGGGYQSADFATYFHQEGLGAQPSVEWVSVDGNMNVPGSVDDTEVALDVEVAGSVAPLADIVVYFAPWSELGWIHAISMAVMESPVLPTVVSVSWGWPETLWGDMAISAIDAALADAVALGITVCISSGDWGSNDGTSGQTTEYPASSPHALACGGTVLQSDGVNILDEVGWPGSGGGISAMFPPPPWQNFGYSGRAVPDVAANAVHYKIHFDGADAVVNGTSAVAPLYAGLIALCAESMLGSHGAGFLNFTIYEDFSAQSTFRDITAGSNGGYSAQPGYDLVTGWGSPNGAALLDVLETLSFAQVQLQLS
ncbi:Kumamolysin [Caballeronia sordidicola]|uniref:Kumamolysin n=2 Tax=Caballeronia sordidicola TaxID=196367 RepID=A0A226WQE1_CABSO|nr:Kumamolysin [Caballeronia sordidicola]